MGRLKFGVFLPFYGFQAKTAKEHYQQLQTITLECERLGYDSVWLDDHLMYGDTPILECWTTLSALAAQTSKIRLGTMVTCTAHRNPALLAKAAATLDVISGGRLELGLGSGVQEKEHLAYGFGYPKPRVRAEQLAESLEIITRLWTEETASYQGRHYHLNGAVCQPKPQQKPHPPLIVGGNGKKHTLPIAARYADRFDWGYLPLEEYRRKLAVLERLCREVGRDFGAIERSCWPSGQVLMAQTQREVDAKVKLHRPKGTTHEEYERYTLAATPEGCITRLQAYLDLGVTYFMLYFADLPCLESLRLFSQAAAQLR
ncbi:MAG: TIGR03560 family F420-dependent LLM class oxidoreductase [Candidatus Bathyarchaeota archaeon]|nr:TIGR03560 family F420-dependent LLM class oxidoreductase [Candidatus Bathyarchaeota archaeon]